MADTKFLDYSGLSHLIDRIDEKYIDTTEVKAPISWDSEGEKIQLDYTSKFNVLESGNDAGKLDINLSGIAGTGLDESSGQLVVDPSDFAGDSISSTNGELDVVVDGTTIKNDVENQTSHKYPLYVNLDGIIDGETIVNNNGQLEVDTSALNIPSAYTLPTATTSVKGGVKIGDGLVMGGTDNEFISADVDGTTIAINNSGKLGVVSGVYAPLDNSGKVPAANLPSYVDDVIEGYYRAADAEAVPAVAEGFFSTRTGSGTEQDPYVYTNDITGETGKIYLDLGSNSTYRYSGSTFVEITSGAYDIITNAEIDTLMGIS